MATQGPSYTVCETIKLGFVNCQTGNDGSVERSGVDEGKNSNVPPKRLNVGETLPPKAASKSWCTNYEQDGLLATRPAHRQPCEGLELDPRAQLSSSTRAILVPKTRTLLAF